MISFSKTLYTLRISLLIVLISIFMVILTFLTHTTIFILLNNGTDVYAQNPHDVILLNYNASIIPKVASSTLRHVIATYELNYGKGKVIALGICSDDIITNGKFQRVLDSLIVRYSPVVKV
jgi:hypothetical protein